MKKLILLIPLFSLLFARGDKPSWVDKRPNNPGYYHGLGVVPVTGATQEYTQRAKDAALNDIAQQIMVSIDASQMSKISEKLGDLKEEFESAVRTSTKADLEGVEAVDTWEGDGQYWVYHRLNIEEYKRIQAEKLRKATALGLDFYSKAKSAEKNNSLSDALQLYVQALSAVEKFINETMEVQYGAGKIFLTNEIFSSIQSLLNQVELKAKNPKIDAQVGKPLRTPLEVIVTNTATTQPVPNFPVKYAFIRGSGDIVPNSKSDKSGIAATQIAKVIGTEKLQLVKAEANVAGMMGENASPLLVMLAKSFTGPDARFTMNVVSLTIMFETEEMLLGNKLKLPRIEPLLKNSLSSSGFTFVDDPAKANMVVSIKSNGRDGGEYQGLYSVYVDANISVLDLNSGEEVYKTSFNNVKGVSINYDKAGMKAYDEIAVSLQKKVIPKILESLKK
ncbi:MAG: LPP20 family lipoprotein [Ignavibacteriales bacterium]|nr:LPP20 family lipoprotein [Ignavibacteriales bacterium]